MLKGINRIVIQLMAAMFLSLPVLALAAPDEGFDHASTGFPLTGGHASTDCESCHRVGIFRGTPRQCVSCHMQQEIAGSSVKSATHIATTNMCEDCHDTRRWEPVNRVDHSSVIGNCLSCHNGLKAAGKPFTHVVSSNQCEQCHRTSMWGGARYNHADVSPGQCSTCHNGTTATGKTASHLPTTWSCDECHSTRRWTPASYNHSGVTPGQCSSCHNGITATGKTASHLPTTLSCDECHSTRSWLPASFDHTGVAPGQCSSCHNGTTATGKSIGHLTTTASCDVCHKTTAWLPASFTHSSANYPKHGISLTCSDCHSSSSYTIAWTYAPPDCITCHASDFSKEHSSSQSASYHYCTSCHEHSTSLTSGRW